tara:strand:- start:1120 stop:1656 length:537 start_codon:yes stop_codon:yes gene_type:complete
MVVMKKFKIFDSIHTNDGHEIFWLHEYDLATTKIDIDPDDLTLDKNDFMDKCEEIVKESLGNPNISYRNYSLDEEIIDQWNWEHIAEELDAKAVQENDLWRIDFSECYALKDEGNIEMNEKNKKWKLVQFFDNGVTNEQEFNTYDEAKAYDSGIEFLHELIGDNISSQISYDDSSVKA